MIEIRPIFIVVIAITLKQILCHNGIKDMAIDRYNLYIF